MIKSECPACNEMINLGKSKENDIIECPKCGADLEIFEIQAQFSVHIQHIGLDHGVLRVRVTGAVPQPEKGRKVCEKGCRGGAEVQAHVREAVVGVFAVEGRG